MNNNLDQLVRIDQDSDLKQSAASIRSNDHDEVVLPIDTYWIAEGMPYVLVGEPMTTSRVLDGWVHDKRLAASHDTAFTGPN